MRAVLFFLGQEINDWDTFQFSCTLARGTLQLEGGLKIGYEGRGSGLVDSQQSIASKACCLSAILRKSGQAVSSLLQQLSICI